MRLKIALAVLAAVCVVWIFSQSVAQVQEAKGLGPVPDITIHPANGDGKPISLSSLKGKVVLVDLWATWCGPCRMSIPGTVDLYNRYHAKGFEVIGVALEQDGGSQVAPFAKQYGMTYPVGLPTAADPVRDLETKLGSSGIPLMALVDRKGNIRFVQRGYAPGIEKDVEARVNELLKES